MYISILRKAIFTEKGQTNMALIWPTYGLNMAFDLKTNQQVSIEMGKK